MREYSKARSLPYWSRHGVFKFEMGLGSLRPCPRAAHRGPPSSLRTQGPIPRDLSIRGMATPHTKLPPAAMGPRFRGDDIVASSPYLLTVESCFSSEIASCTVDMNWAGKMMVEFFSIEISAMVCKVRS